MQNEKDAILAVQGVERTWGGYLKLPLALTVPLTAAIQVVPQKSANATTVNPPLVASSSSNNNSELNVKIKIGIKVVNSKQKTSVLVEDLIKATVQKFKLDVNVHWVLKSADEILDPENLVCEHIPKNGIFQLEKFNF